MYSWPMHRKQKYLVSISDIETTSDITPTFGLFIFTCIQLISKINDFHEFWSNWECKWKEYFFLRCSVQKILSMLDSIPSIANSHLAFSITVTHSIKIVIIKVWIFYVSSHSESKCSSGMNIKAKRLITNLNIILSVSNLRDAIIKCYDYQQYYVWFCGTQGVNIFLELNNRNSFNFFPLCIPI